MPSVTRVLALSSLIVASILPLPAIAQAEFIRGTEWYSGALVYQNLPAEVDPRREDDGASIRGFALSGAVSPQVAISLAVATTRVPVGLESEETGSTVVLSASNFPVRQTEELPLTAEAAVGLGYVSYGSDGEFIASVGLKAALTLAPTDQIMITPTSEGALVIPFTTGQRDTSPTFSFGLGVGVAFTPDFVAFARPNVAFVSQAEERVTSLGVTFGVVFSP